MRRRPSAIAADCATLGLTGDACTRRGSLLHRGLPRHPAPEPPGRLRRRGPVLQRRARRAHDAARRAGVGSGSHRTRSATSCTPPPGAPAPGGGTDYTAPNFRRTVVIGEQLSAAVTAPARAGDTAHRHAHDLRDPAVHDPADELRLPRARSSSIPATGRPSLGTRSRASCSLPGRARQLRDVPLRQLRGRARRPRRRRLPRRRPPAERGRVPAHRPGRDDVPPRRDGGRARERPAGDVPHASRSTWYVERTGHSRVRRRAHDTRLREAAHARHVRVDDRPRRATSSATSCRSRTSA